MSAPSNWKEGKILTVIRCGNCQYEFADEEKLGDHVCDPDAVADYIEELKRMLAEKALIDNIQGQSKAIRNAVETDIPVPKEGTNEPNLGSNGEKEFYNWLDSFPIIPDDTKCYEYQEVYKEGYRTGYIAGYIEGKSHD